MQFADLQARDFGQAAVKMQWINHFQTTLYDLSQRLVQLDKGELDGATLSCEQSPSQVSQSASMARLHVFLRDAHPEELDDFATKDLDDPGRFVFFHAFVNETYTNIWRAGFNAVRVPGLVPYDGESPAALYARVVRPEVIAFRFSSALRQVAAAGAVRSDVVEKRTSAFRPVLGQSIHGGDWGEQVRKLPLVR